MSDVTPADLKEAADMLGILEKASPNEIRQKYHEQIKTWHPDVSTMDPVI
jgi:curved DNA-binding protein CbpA